MAKSTLFYDFPSPRKHFYVSNAASESSPCRSQVKRRLSVQAVLLAPVHRQPSLPGIDLIPVTFRTDSVLQWRDRAGLQPDFPIKPSQGHLYSYIYNSHSNSILGKQKWTSPIANLSLEEEVLTIGEIHLA